MKFNDVQKRLHTITEECLNYIVQLMSDHGDKIIHFEEENAYWINLDNTERQVRSVTCFLIYDEELYFTIDDDELTKNTMPIPLLNSFSTDTFHEIINATLIDFMYKANEHTDAVEAVDMLHMTEWYYKVD